MTKDQIRAIFMANGFTIKEGQTDLKDYVYAAAEALLAASASAEPVAWQYENKHGNPFLTHRDPATWHPHDREGFKNIVPLYAAPRPIEAPDNSQPVIADTAKPVAWVRYRSDGGFEGPIMDTDTRMCDTRRSFWTPLYASPAIDAASDVDSSAVAHHQPSYEEGYKEGYDDAETIAKHTNTLTTQEIEEIAAYVESECKACPGMTTLYIVAETAVLETLHRLSLPRPIEVPENIIADTAGAKWRLERDVRISENKANGTCTVYAADVRALLAAPAIEAPAQAAGPIPGGNGYPDAMVIKCAHCGGNGCFACLKARAALSADKDAK